ncbi:His-Xaa-Ser system radical SAM maturase HxsC [Dysgonomonas hofstadii]|uniref:His-Xaa-Ser system radical SAM maturase HxsC n=2 Tax=Dysgonomonas hofstadii TaxID=637886 RepID=A0A840CP48_9BACT|nr:His-Xaa-Ser system radical SAM maturase HxsC [Dysgonomonas hofstadii]
MCSQPPLNRDDIDLLFERNLVIIESAPSELTDIGITGGEPTLLGDKLFLLIEKVKEKLPKAQIHILSNGRAFANRAYAKKLANIRSDRLLLGIPLHSDYSHDHDHIAQAAGSYNETVKGLYNLAEFNIRIELRIVINKINYQRLPQLSNFIYKNLPFVTHISFMGLEDTGYSIKNHERVWIAPIDFQVQLEKAVINLATWGLDVSVFNLPLCSLPLSLHEFARKSISDWKVKYLEECSFCSMKDICCGLFATSKGEYKIKPII